MESGSSQRDEICRHCQDTSKHIQEAYQNPSIDLGTFITEGDRQTARALVSCPGTELMDLEYRGHSVGKIAFHDMALAVKAAGPESLEEKHVNLWKDHIRAIVVAYEAARRVLDSYAVDSIITFNNYAVLLGPYLAALDTGVSFYTITHASHRNADRRRMVMTPGLLRNLPPKLANDWEERWQDLCLPADTIGEIAADTIRKFSGQGSHVYSPSQGMDLQSLYDELGIPRENKVLVAYTSSLDERVALNTLADALSINWSPTDSFKDHFEWIDMLIEYSKARPWLSVVIRVHPREGLTKGSKLVSEHLKGLMERYSEQSDVIMVWPNDAISSYDLAEIADVATSLWSSIGLELMRLGVPFLHATAGHGPYPKQTDYFPCASSPADYISILEQLFSRGPRLKTLRAAYRWYHLSQLACALLLDEYQPDLELENFPMPMKSDQFKPLVDIIEGRTTTRDIWYQQLAHRNSSKHQLLETISILLHLNRIIFRMYTELVAETPISLSIDGLALPVGTVMGELRKTEDGFYCFVYNGRTYTRRSKLISRLVEMIRAEIVNIRQQSDAPLPTQSSSVSKEQAAQAGF